MQDAAADLFKAPAALMAFGGLFFVVVAVRLQAGTKMLTDRGLLSGSREEICIPALKKVIKKKLRATSVFFMFVEHWRSVQPKQQ